MGWASEWQQLGQRHAQNYAHNPSNNPSSHSLHVSLASREGFTCFSPRAHACSSPESRRPAVADSWQTNRDDGNFIPFSFFFWAKQLAMVTWINVWPWQCQTLMPMWPPRPCATDIGNLCLSDSSLVFFRPRLVRGGYGSGNRISNVKAWQKNELLRASCTRALFPLPRAT